MRGRARTSAAILQVAGLAMLYTACGNDELTLPTCNCPTGCCRNGQCLAGNTDDACGLPNSSCQVCMGGTRCQLGTCIADTPTPTACTRCETGCCRGTLCTAGTADDACGGGGQLCADCASSQLVCDAQERRCKAKPSANPCDGCTGCCSEDGCEEGTQQRACGKGGGQCLDCDALGQVCDAATGTCRACASGCAGCCRDNACQAGTAVDACGKGGAACVDCKVVQQVCDAQEQACKAPGTTPSKRYDVILVRAHVDSPWYACWESTCDLWVQVTAGTATGKSPSIDNNNDPEWNLYLLTAPEDALLTALGVKVFDDDGLGASLVSVATCKAQLAATDLDGKEVTLSCDDLVSSAVATVTLRFQQN
jgi:hypothetical protein